MRTRPARDREGFALLVVLALILPLGALVAVITAEATSEMRVARLMKAAAEAEAMADGGVHEAIAGLLGRLPAMDVKPDGLWRNWRRPGGTLRVRVTPEDGRIALNHAAPALLKCAFLEAGLGEGDAEKVVRALRGRDEGPGRSEGSDQGKALSIEALQNAPGMTPASYARLEGVFTIYAKERRPRREAAPAVVLAILDRCPEAQGPGAVADREDADEKQRRPGPVRIEVVASSTSATFARTAVVDPRQVPSAVLSWEIGARADRSGSS